MRFGPLQDETPEVLVETVGLIDVVDIVINELFQFAGVLNLDGWVSTSPVSRPSTSRKGR